MEHRTLSRVLHGSAAYRASVVLRNEVLRRPLGLELSREELERERAHYHLVCEKDGLVLGCLVLVPQAAGEVRMRQVAVSPSAQGQGVGRALTAFAEEFARQQGFERVVLHARATAVGFYEKQGYERVGEEFEQLTLPHWRMHKRL